jgi:hypothetical protein
LSDKRAEILEWLGHAAALPTQHYPMLAVRALRAEVEAHGDPEAIVRNGTCLCCLDSYGESVPNPCPTIERIHTATVGAGL